MFVLKHKFVRNKAMEVPSRSVLMLVKMMNETISFQEIKDLYECKGDFGLVVEMYSSPTMHDRSVQLDYSIKYRYLVKGE
jgi:hypothetical protein